VACAGCRGAPALLDEKKDFKGACEDFHKANTLGVLRAKQYFDVCE
jgi:hypothetical protein